MFLYYRISFVASLLALAVWAITVAVYEAPRHGDGYGPDPLGVLLYLSLWPVGLLLAHSGLLAVWCARGSRRRSCKAGRGLPSTWRWERVFWRMRCTSSPRVECREGGTPGAV
ncbi:hypothetical protein ACOTHX_03985 [Achromobacter xylosoxidans]|uniref:hypothetical protein n=1 Tax=Alcaligenes xylosoxydans xylosoxydans TaxID=85698 RepID=UPI003BA45328